MVLVALGVTVRSRERERPWALPLQLYQSMNLSSLPGRDPPGAQERQREPPLAVRHVQPVEGQGHQEAAVEGKAVEEKAAAEEPSAEERVAEKAATEEPQSKRQPLKNLLKRRLQKRRRLWKKKQWQKNPA